MNIHEYRCSRGRSALHCLIDNGTTIHLDRYHLPDAGHRFSGYNYFIDNSEENHCDAHGFSYFHAACMLGNIEAVRRFIGADPANVNLDAYARSPLHLACEYRQLDVARVLLEHGADPRRPDVDERSSPLHALARLQICDCEERCNAARLDRDAIVELLVAKGANIEARNYRGFTCLELAASLLDLELARSFFKHGASVQNFVPNKMFNDKFASIELRKYPTILRLAEMIQLLASNGFVMDFRVRFMILKHWIRFRGNDIDYLIPNVRESYWDQITGYHNLVMYLNVYEKYGLFKKQEVVDCFRKKHDDRCRNIMSRLSHPETVGDWKSACNTMEELETEVAKMKSIMLTESVSVYRFCQMSHREGFAILKEIKDFRLPALRDLKITRIMVYRHIANAMMRLHFELFAADLFMTDHCIYRPEKVCDNLRPARARVEEDIMRHDPYRDARFAKLRLFVFASRIDNK
ncbi:unnamed protein product [Trichogramma brassicae]|uniref:Uncharacterized protein n=1 Tax=Trichogramma brassicae TaxID=86971 RepID=A0A6H5I8K7_9HYME|nr:unnamed protein product [Trichogramma brassicae]